MAPDEFSSGEKNNNNKKFVLFTVRWSVQKLELENRRLVYLASTIGTLTGLSEYYNRQHFFSRWNFKEREVTF